jgi:hypothetical protein
MKNKRRATETGLIKALILGVITATVARAGIAYLPLTGPPALRVLTVTSPKLTSMTAVPAMKIETMTKIATADTNCPEIKAFNTNTTETVVSSAGGNGPNYTGTMPAITMGPGNPLDVPGNISGFALTAQSNFGITPEMLATYFQPLAVGTNGVVVAAPFRVGFIPPFAQPDKSSHAEYIVK